MNPYHTLLELPESETKPDHYRLLGLQAFEDDFRRIHAAAVSRNTQLRSWDNSKYWREANHLLDEVVAAAAVLEDPAQKAAYDQQLRSALGLPAVRPPAEPAETEVVKETAPVSVQPLKEAEPPPLEKLPVRRPKKPPPKRQAAEETATGEPQNQFDRLFLLIAGGVLALAALIAAGVMLATGRRPSAVAPPVVAVSPINTVNPDPIKPDQDTAPDTPGTAPAPGSTPSPESASADSTSPELNAIRWDENRLTLTPHQGIVRALAVSPDGVTIASGSADTTIRLLHLATGKELRTLRGHKGEIHSLAFSPDGATLASGCDDLTVKLWDVKTGQVRRTLTGHSAGRTMALFSPDGQLLATCAMYDGSIKIWNPETGVSTQTLAQDRGRIATTLAGFSPNGQTVAASSEGGRVHFWNINTGEQLDTTFTGSTAVALSIDGRLVAGGQHNGVVDCFDVVKRAPVPLAQTASPGSSGGPIWCVAFSPDGSTLAAGSFDRIIKVWDVASGQQTFSLAGQIGQVTALAFSRDGRTLISGSDKEIKFWGPGSVTATESVAAKRTPRPGYPAVHKMPGLTQASNIRSVVAFPTVGNSLIAVDGTSGSVLEIDVEQGRVLTSVRNPSLASQTGRAIIALAPPERRVLAWANDDRDPTMRIWDTRTNQSEVWTPDSAAARRLERNGLKVVTTVARIPPGLLSLAWSPDGSTIARSERDYSVSVWDARNGSQHTSGYGHAGEVDALAFSPDGRYLASGSRDTTIRLWEANAQWATSTKAWRVLGTPTSVAAGGSRKAKAKRRAAAGSVSAGHTAEVLFLDFSPDGNTLVSLGPDQIRAWDTSTGAGKTIHDGSTDRIDRICMSPDGQWLAAAGNGKVFLWDVDTWSLRHTLAMPGTASDCTSLSISADGRWLAATLRQTGLVVWDLTGSSTSQSSAEPAPPAPGSQSPGATGNSGAGAFTTTKSGLKYRILRKSNGRKPGAAGTVTVHYKGWLDNGDVFDDSHTRGQPARFQLTQVIKGWTEGLQLIGQGGIIELEIPPDLGYGDRGAPPIIPAKATLHFEIELLGVQ